jgi:hypothetical protein
MQRLAAELRSDADRAEAVARDVDRSVQTMQFQGPAAERMRTASRSWTGLVRQHCAELRGLADTLARSAGQVEAARRAQQHRDRAPLR